MPRNKMAHAKVIIARNSVQRIPIGNPNIYCSVYIPPKCICTALFIFLPSVYVLHCLHFSQVHVLCIVHIPLKCMYCIVYISPKSMCYVLFIYLPSAYVLHCLNFSQVHVLCIVYIPPSPCVLHCLFFFQVHMSCIFPFLPCLCVVQCFHSCKFMRNYNYFLWLQTRNAIV